jgi:UDP-glucose 4-epimerase
MTKVIVIGGSGFMGSYIANELKSRNFEVTIFDKYPPSLSDFNHVFHQGDINDYQELYEAIKGNDIVYHMAAVADIKEAAENPYKTITDNIMGTVNAVDASVNVGVKKFMYGSTVYVYSRLGSFYRATKQAAETLIEAYEEKYDFDYTILRYGSLYGPRAQDWNGLRKLVRSVLVDKKVVFGGEPDERREYIHVADAARISVDALDDEYSRQALTITGTQVLTAEELIDLVSEIVGGDIDVSYDPAQKDHNHYKLTPYQYIPKSSVKIVPKKFVDIGQGVLELIEELYHQKMK